MSTHVNASNTRRLGKEAPQEFRKSGLGIAPVGPLVEFGRRDELWAIVPKRRGEGLGYLGDSRHACIVALAGRYREPMGRRKTRQLLRRACLLNDRCYP